ncbi:uncharacterized protein LAESUDRAFT_384885 [Laetiporus sulphureus 93-53]|uniref:Uncharacterized protein n=1 Tax=Laetiporus sulphureus 93-53 TaxID=1314785 RepID=A0A165CMV3_9APHY|nr:uncharacterized protein LAESUDRAFT_384885 [Laetiporus sulphureus 93-53]KZT03099.1 hypothetical protein LAESUDRAFT_384885 [Laetiporus sulphureus 93-53]
MNSCNLLMQCISSSMHVVDNNEPATRRNDTVWEGHYDAAIPASGWELQAILHILEPDDAARSYTYDRQLPRIRCQRSGEPFRSQLLSYGCP